MTIPKKIRLEINEAVRDIEQLDPYCEDPQSFEEKMRKAIGVLDKRGVIPESDYRKRLKLVENLAKTSFEERKREDEEWNRPIEQKKQSHVQIYSGLLRKVRIKVCIDVDKYSLKRFPDKNKDVSFRWRFNANGRLENLDLTTRFGSERIVSINNMKIMNGASEIEYYPIPDIASPFMAYFKDNPKPLIYQTLIRLGYFNTNDLFNDLSLGKIKPHPISDGETPLIDIVNNRNAMQMINATASIFPEVEVKSNGEYVLKYKPNRDRVKER